LEIGELIYLELVIFPLSPRESLEEQQSENSHSEFVNSRFLSSIIKKKKELKEKLYPTLTN
jgi:hypothetical protein